MEIIKIVIDEGKICTIEDCDFRDECRAWKIPVQNEFVCDLRKLRKMYLCNEK